jgi:transposase
MTGHNPTDRSKLGTKRHILTDKDGIPLSAIITSANTHDVTVAIDTVDSMVLKRSSSKLNDRKKQNLCLDKAYHSKEIEQEIIKRGYIPHIRYRREEQIFRRKHPLRRWVVEREQIHGITDSGNYLQGMKRRMRTILVLYNWLIA